VTQAGLSVVGGLFGLAAYFIAPDWRWVLGAVALLMNWPYAVHSMPGEVLLASWRS
jgi:hypothetical protein